MESDSWLGLVFVVLSLVILTIATAAEVSVDALRARGRMIERRGRLRMRSTADLLLHASQLRPAVTIVRTLALVTAAALAVALSVHLYSSSWGPIAAGAGIALLLLALLQLVVRTLAARYPEDTLITVGPPMWLLLRLTRPLAIALERTAGWVAGGPEPYEPATEEEAEKALIKEMESEHGAMEPEEREMIEGIFELEEKTAGEIMVPRIDIVAAGEESSLDQVADLIQERGYSRIPVYRETIDQIIGVVYAKDVLHALRQPSPPVRLADIARPAYFIPESKRMDELLKELRKQRVHMAIVVDEYGGTAGLVTIEDLLEEIVGEIADEYDVEEPRIEHVSDDELLMDAGVSIADLNDALGTDLQGENFNTVGGFIYTHLGKIPAVGEQIAADGLLLSVLSTAGRRIRKVRVQRLAQEGEE